MFKLTRSAASTSSKLIHLGRNMEIPSSRPNPRPQIILVTVKVKGKVNWRKEVFQFIQFFSITQSKRADNHGGFPNKGQTKIEAMLPPNKVGKNSFHHEVKTKVHFLESCKVDLQRYWIEKKVRWKTTNNCSEINECGVGIMKKEFRNNLRNWFHFVVWLNPHQWKLWNSIFHEFRVNKHVFIRHPKLRLIHSCTASFIWSFSFGGKTLDIFRTGAKTEFTFKFPNNVHSTQKWFPECFHYF